MDQILTLTHDKFRLFKCWDLVPFELIFRLDMRQSWCWNRLRLWGILGWGECILQVGWTWSGEPTPLSWTAFPLKSMQIPTSESNYIWKWGLCRCNQVISNDWHFYKMKKIWHREENAMWAKRHTAGGGLDMKTEAESGKDIKGCQQQPEARREARNSFPQSLPLERINLNSGLLATQIYLLSHPVWGSLSQQL